MPTVSDRPAAAARSTCTRSRRATAPTVARAPATPATRPGTASRSASSASSSSRTPRGATRRASRAIRRPETSPGGQRDVLRTSGNKRSTRPDTDPPVVGLVAGVDRARRARRRHGRVRVERRSDPRAVVITGRRRSHRALHALDGNKSVSGCGVIGIDGKLAVLFDVSTPPDGTLTATATLTSNGLTSAVGSTTVVKNTRFPGSLGIAQPGLSASPASGPRRSSLTGIAGNYVTWELDGPGYPLYRGRLPRLATGRLVVILDFTGFPGQRLLPRARGSTIRSRATYRPSAFDADANARHGRRRPAASRQGAANTLTNNPCVTLSLSFADDRAVRPVPGPGLATAGRRGRPGRRTRAPLTLTLPSPDATYTVSVQVADKAGNYVLDDAEGHPRPHRRRDRRGAQRAEQRHLLRRRHADRR